MSNTVSRNSKVSGGVERSFESIDVRHPLFPVSLYLIRERFYNSYRHGATKVLVFLQKLPSGNFIFKIRDTSDGNADVNRLLEPAEESGATSSQYGFGERILRYKTSGRDGRSIYAWKKKGDMFYTFLEQENGRYKTASINLSPEGIWTSPEEHGFYSEMEFLRDRLEDRSPEDIVPIIRSVLCMSLTQAVLDSIHIRIEVRNVAGEILREHVNPGKPTKAGKPRKVREGRIVGVSDSRDDNWKSLVEILEDNQLEEYETVEGVLGSGAKIEVQYTCLKHCEGKTYYDGLKEYTEKKACAVLVQMHDFIVPIPLPEALGKAPHPASQNGRFVIVKATPATLTPEDRVGKTQLEIEHISQKSMMTLASSKVTFLSTCRIYQEMIRFIRENKPAGWDAWKKESPASSPASSPARVPAPASASVTEDESSVEVPTVADRLMVWYLANETRIKECMARPDIRPRLNL